jgi:hypothetical protein
LDSKHASGIPSTVSILSDRQIRARLISISYLDLEEHIVANRGRDQGTKGFYFLRDFLMPSQQQLKDEFFSTLGSGKSKKDDTEAKIDDGKEEGTIESTSKPQTKPKLQFKKKKVEDDPFASDDDEEDGNQKTKNSKPPSKATLNPNSKVVGKPPSKTGTSAKKPPSKAGAPTKRIREESESEEDMKPKRRAPSKSMSKQ